MQEFPVGLDGGQCAGTGQPSGCSGLRTEIRERTGQQQHNLAGFAGSEKGEVSSGFCRGLELSSCSGGGTRLDHEAVVQGWVALHGCWVGVSACLIGVWVLFMGAHSGGSLWGLFDAGGMLPQSFFSYLGSCVG